ncbi:MAG TPA: flotillin [Caldithrix abyssi]|uniref:Flotillin n=1 Tax=Caldithrix abyssi TaxID=187145 RepID=A0A7V4TZI3_CALAY|nr:flotillin [Caldithrix abyssi]
MSAISVLIIFVVIVVVIIAGLWYYRKQFHKVGPNEVLIISGGRKNFVTLPDGSKMEIGFRYRIGGGSFVNPVTESVSTMSVEVVPIHGKATDVLTRAGIPLNLEYTAQVKIDTSDYALYLAITNFLSKGTTGILEVSQTILEGKIREVSGTLSVEDIISKSTQFADMVEKGVRDDFADLGLTVLSFGLKEIGDPQGYIEALSRPHITKARYEAEVDKAEKDRDITIKSAEAKKEGEIARLAAEAQIAGKNWENEALKAESQVKVNQKKARADMAYELERYKLQQELKKEEYAIKKLEMQEATNLEEMSIAKREKELEANVIKPAEARKIQVQMEADAENYRIAAEAQGKIKAKKLEDQAQAEQIRQIGEAEAEALKQKAEAYESYNQAAVIEMILEKMPELASAISEPLSKVDKITMIESDGKLGGSKITGQVAEILSQLPEVVEALTGADLKKYLKKKLSDDE